MWDMSRRHDDVLTDYVRERLDRLVARSATVGTDEAALRTVLRPRPVLGAARQESTGDPAPAPGPVLAPVPEAKSAPELSGAEALLGRFTRQHVLVVGALLAVGVLIAAFALTRARAVPIEPPVAVVAAPVEQSAPNPSPEPSPTTEPILVHVVGEVVTPGVHRLPTGARVADAIEAAGGLTENARPGELNLAQTLADGQQVVIGGPKRPSEIRGGGEGSGADGDPAATSGPPGATKLNLNTASAAQLDTLPGVGPVTAEKVVAWRAQHGKFTRVEELQEVPGIGPKTFAEIAPHVTV